MSGLGDWRFADMGRDPEMWGGISARKFKEVQAREGRMRLLKKYQERMKQAAWRGGMKSVNLNIERAIAHEEAILEDRKRSKGDSKYNRETVTREPRPGRGTSRNGMGDQPSRQGFWDQPKTTQPRATSRNRLGALGSKSGGGAGGTWAAGYGRSGLPMRSSFHARAATNAVKNPLSRVRLTEVGYFAVVMAQIGNQELQAFDREAIKRGAAGGYLSLNPDEKVQLLSDQIGPSADIISAPVRRGLGQLGSFAIGLSAALDLYHTWAWGGDLEAASNRVSSYTEQTHLLEAWVQGGSEGYDAMKSVIQNYGSPEGKVVAEAKRVRNERVGKIQRKFYKQSANKLAGKIIGMSGADVLNDLNTMYAGEGSIAEEFFYKNTDGGSYGSGTGKHQRADKGVKE